MKILRDLQSENQLGGCYRILGNTNLKHDCQILLFNTLNFQSYSILGILSLFQIKEQ